MNKYNYRYEFIINDEVKDRITVDSKDELIKCIKAMKWQDKMSK